MSGPDGQDPVVYHSGDRHLDRKQAAAACYRFGLDPRSVYYLEEFDNGAYAVIYIRDENGLMKVMNGNIIMCEVVIATGATTNKSATLYSPNVSQEPPK